MKSSCRRERELERIRRGGQREGKGSLLLRLRLATETGAGAAAIASES